MMFRGLRLSKTLARGAGVGVCSCMCAAAAASPPEATRPARERAAEKWTLKSHVEGEAGRLLKPEADADWEARRDEAEALLLRVALSSQPVREDDAWREAARTVVLMRLIAGAHEGDRASVAAAIDRCPDTADHLAALLNGGDDLAAAAQVLLTLYGAFGDRIEKDAALAAAMCAVHDREVVSRVNENTRPAPPVEALFAYFASTGSKFALDTRKGPPELLCFVVDAAPDVSELHWAMQRYGGHPQVGALYLSIAYDRDHFLLGTPKKISVEGFTLQNIQRYGGICADQAYFTAMVGKAIGVPAVQITGAGKSGVWHAWVGYLKGAGRGGAARWDVSDGRHAESKYYSGRCEDPRTGRLVSEAEVGVTEALSTARRDDVTLARAIVEAAALVATAKEDPPRIGQGGGEGGGEGASEMAFVRSRGVGPAEELLREAARECGVIPDLWWSARSLAGTFDERTMARWVDAAAAVGGNRWPEFAFAQTDRLLENVRDDRVAGAAWERLYERFRSRPDLALRAQVRLAERAAAAGMKREALGVYERAITQYASGGAFVLEAIDGLEELLSGEAGATEEARMSALAQVLSEAWRRLERPSAATIAFDQTLWCKVGKRYAGALRDAGRERDADSVLRQIDSMRPPEAQ